MWSTVIAAVASALSMSTTLYWPQSHMHNMQQTAPMSDRMLLRQMPSLAEHHAKLVAAVAQLASTPAPNATAEDVRSYMVDFVAQSVEVFGLKSAALAIVELDDGNETQFSSAIARDRSRLDSSKALFRIASITKSMTAAALLMLVQSGQLTSLDDSVDAYLDPELRYTADDAAFGGPITVRHLLTHTAGFAESIVAQIVDDDSLMLPLPQYLARVRPPRVYPVGAVPSYSNFGYSLLGRVIERLTNQTWEAFLRARLFDPLGMRESVISPRDPAVLNDRSYWDRVAPQWAINALAPGGDGVEYGPYVFQYAPAGSVLLTADDMARYARFHLERGRAPDGTQLLDAALVDELHRAQVFSQYGIGYGFQRVLVGRNSVGVQHDGDMPTASSRLLLLPEQRRAIFISLGKGGVPVRDTMNEEYGARFTDGQYALEPPLAGPYASDRPLVDGDYLYTRTTHGGCLDFLFRASTPEVRLVGREQFVGLGRPYPGSPLDYVLRNATEKYVYAQAESSGAGLLGFPFLVASSHNGGARADGRAAYVTLSDATAGFFIDDSPSYSSRLGAVVASIVFVAIAVLMLLASCCRHQCSKGAEPFERDYSAKLRSKRLYHDAAIYCYTPIQIGMMVVVIGNYSLTAVQMTTGFVSIGAFVFFPFAFAVFAALGVLFAVGACVLRVWWLDRRVVFAIVQVSFIVFAVVWGALGGGYHTHCWNADP
jgi:CubicO group peptidase (beta-lactamase class C family)